MTLLNIRAYVEDSDLAELKRIYFESRSSTFTWMRPDSFTEEDFVSDTQGESILVAESDKIVGFSSVWAADSFIHHLYLCPKETGKGYGSKLLRATIENFGLPLRLKCLVKNLPAVSFYTNRNWAIVGSGASSEGEYYEMELAGIT